MPWQSVTTKDLAKRLNINEIEVREKQKLMHTIRAARHKADLTQTELASMIGVTQSRIAQIETGVGTSNISFEILFHILYKLGYDCKILTKKSIR